MPRKNVIKELWAGGYYHVYNRGVAKQPIFKKKADYQVFLRYLKEYLLPKEHPDRLQLQGLNPRRKAMICYGEVKLYAFCLMPNHFHLQIKNLTQDGLATFMRAVCTNYSMYFNHEYDRVGPLFQSTYKAVETTNDGQLLSVNRYIHRNPIPNFTRVKPLYQYEYSSYPAYLGHWRMDWLDTEEIGGRFSTSNPRSSYQNFVEQIEEIPKSWESLYLGMDDEG